MRAFAIQIGTDYIKDEHSPMSLLSYCKHLDITDDIDESKNWKIRSTPKTWLKNAKIRCAEELASLEQQEETIKNEGARSWNTYRLGSITTSISDIKQIYEKLGLAEVIEIDVENPNFRDSGKPKYNKYYSNTMFMTKDKLTTSKHVCESCGVILKNIEFFTFGFKNIHVCVPCMKMRIDTINEAYDNMDEQLREELRNNYLLNAI
jgi:hypothetical protein